MSILGLLDLEALKVYRGMGSVEGKRRFLGVYFKNNFLGLIRLLGYKEFAGFHYGAIDKLAKVKKLTQVEVIQNLWLWSRGFFKTTLITELHTIYLILNNPNIRILVRSYTITIAEKMLKNIKGHFLFNDDFRFIFREYCPKSTESGKVDFGTTSEFTVPNRTKILKEPTVLASGIGTNLTGLHFDYMKIDDISTKDSVTNDEQINASKEDYKSLRHLYDMPSCPKEDFTGTIYHFNDLACDLRKKKSHSESFIPCTVNGEVEGEPIFPSRLNDEQIKKLFDDIGPYQTMTQYFLNPVNPADAKFKEEWLKYYETLPSGLSEYICVDPASTAKKKSDYTVIERWGIDSWFIHYLIEGIRDRLTVFQRIDAVIAMVRRSKRLVSVKYEVLGGRHGDLETLNKRFIEENIPLIATETKNTNSSKKDRIEQRLVTPFHQGRIFFPRTLSYKSLFDGKVKDFVQDYILEYLQFPFTEHDDVLDCHSQMFEEPQLLQKGLPVEVKQEVKQMTADDYEREYEERKKVKKSNPFITNEQAINLLESKKFNRIIRRARARI